MPGGQGWQSDCPQADANLPVAHASHELQPLLDVPGVQGSHVLTGPGVAPGAVAVPAGQQEQGAPPPSEYVFGLHERQVKAPLA